VISTDENAGIATINRSALWMLGLKDKPDERTPIDRVVEGFKVKSWLLSAAALAEARSLKAK
jgi:hypothetical protein